MYYWLAGLSNTNMTLVGGARKLPFTYCIKITFKTVYHNVFSKKGGPKGRYNITQTTKTFELNLYSE